MNKYIALIFFGAASLANTQGTSNPIIIGKLQKILETTNKMLEKEQAVITINDDKVEEILEQENNVINMKEGADDASQKDDVDLKGPDDSTKNDNRKKVEDIVKNDKDFKDKDPKVQEKNLKKVDDAIKELEKTVAKEIADAQKSLITSQKNLIAEQAKEKNTDRIAAVQVIVAAKQNYLDMVTDQKREIKDLAELKKAIENQDEKTHAYKRSVFLRDDARQNLLETQLNLAIIEAELIYVKLKGEDSKQTEARIATQKELTTKYEAEVKVQEGNVRRLKQNVRMIVIWAVVGLLIVASLLYGCYFINKSEEPQKQKEQFENAEGGQIDDLYYRFIDNEISQ